MALETLKRNGLPSAGFRSKSWDEFSTPDAPRMDFVFTVCDQAASEVCPIWPGHPMTAHWGIPDPAAVEGADEDKRRAFQDALELLRQRVEQFGNLAVDDVGRLAIQREIDEIGRK